jgi:hypothetical protein
MTSYQKRAEKGVLFMRTWVDQAVRPPGVVVSVVHRNLMQCLMGTEIEMVVLDVVTVLLTSAVGNVLISGFL